MDNKTNQQRAIQVSIVTIACNIVLSLFKMVAGVLGKSGAMVSDSVHSMSDVLSTFIVIIGLKLSGKKSDKNHPYGHERFECVAAIILAIILLSTGLGIGYTGITEIFSGNYGYLSVPGTIALIAAIISISAKEGMYWYTRATAKKINSGVLMADAWHHRSDALSSIGSFIGILGAKLGFPIFDPVASVIICIFIIKASIDVFMDAIYKMVDKACDDTTVEKIRAIINQQDGVLGIDQLKTRLFGDKIYVDVEIQADGNETLINTHKIAQKTHDAIENYFPNVKHCMVHINPMNIAEFSDL